MIQKFYEVWTSESFCHLRKELSVAAIGSSPEPSFFQEATDRVYISGDDHCCISSKRWHYC